MPTNPKKRRFRFIAVSALAGLLVFVGLVVAARLLLPPIIADKIRARMAARPEAHFTFKNLGIELLPRPTLKLVECTAILKRAIRLSADAVSIGLSRGALLVGRIEPSQVVVEGIVLQASLIPAWSRSANGEALTGGPWHQILAEARKTAPHLVVIIRGGQGTFQGASQAAQLNISGLEATADLGALQLNLTCRSNLWQRFQVQMDLVDSGLGGRVHAAMEGIQLANLGPWIPAPLGVRLVDGRGKLDLTAQIRNGTVGSVSLATDWPWLTVERRGRQQRLDQLAAQGRLQHHGAQWRLAIDTLTSARPALQIADVDILLDRQGDPAPLVGMDLMVKQARLDDLRTLVLALADSSGRVKQAADLIQGGLVQDVQVQTTAPTPIREMAKLQNWRLAGRLKDLQLVYEGLERPIEIQQGEVAYAQNRLNLSQADLQSGANQLRRLDLALNWQGALQLEGRVESAHIRAEALLALLARIPKLSGRLAKARARGDLHLQPFRIALPGQGLWEVSTKGRADQVTFSSDALPGPLTFAKGQFETTLAVGHSTIALQKAHLNLLDARASLTGRVDFDGRKPSKMDFTLSGSRLGPRMVDWLWAALKWPDSARPRSAVAVNQGHLQWAGQEGFRAQAGLKYAEGPEIALDISGQGARTEIHRLTIQDGSSHASLTGRRQNRQYGLNFDGRLAGRTLAALFPAVAQSADGALDGRLGVSLDLDHIDTARLEGRLQVHDWVLPEFNGHNATLKDIAMTADGTKVALTGGRLVLDDQVMDVTGQIDADSDGLQADLHLQADVLDWQKLRSLFGRGSETAGERALGPPAIGGQMRLTVNRMIFPGYVIAPLQATVAMANGTLRLKLQEAKLCGLALPGTLETLPAGRLRIDLRPTAAGLSLMEALQCLAKERTVIHGTFDLSGRLRAQGPPEGLLSALNGSVDFSAAKGHIDKLPILSKVLAFLNVTEIFAGRLPDLETEGLAYDRFTITGAVANGVLEIESAHLNGPSVEIGSYGTVNLVSNQLDLIVVVAPLKTIDRVIKKIPLVDTILGGNLLAVPVSVKGRWDDSLVIPLDPGAVGDRLLKMFERTITLPGKLLMRPFATQGPAKKEIPDDGRQGSESPPAN